MQLANQSEFTNERIPTLDGLRAVAVGLVLLAHAGRSGGFSTALNGDLFGSMAALGVKIFFVLSGFLITSLLLVEQRRCGRVSLRNFYVRRTLRVFPPAYVYIAAVAVAAYLQIVPLKRGDLLHALTYTMNYHHDRAWSLGNLWSLGVEEQFYLLWPPLFVRLDWRRQTWLLGCVIVAAPALRVFIWIFLPAARGGIDEHFETVCDGLAIGCLLAVLVDRYGVRGLAGKIPAIAFLLAPIACIVCMTLDKWPSFALPFGDIIINLSIGLILLWCVANAQSRVGQVLNSRAAVFIGTISYSLYLWQQIFMDRSLLPQSRVFPATVALSVLAALVSHRLIERPLQGLRRRFRSKGGLPRLAVP